MGEVPFSLRLFIMSNSIQNGIITIHLKKVTPIMKALFAPFEQTDLFDDSYKWVLRINSENNTLPDNWHPIHGALETLCEEYGCKPEGQTRIDILLISLGYHLSQLKDKKKPVYSISFPAVLHCVHHIAFDISPQFEDLFKLAQVFDDGHGVQSIEVGIAEYGDQSISPESYGGHGHYIGKHIAYWLDSYHTFDQGRKIDTALAKNDLDNVVTHLVRELDFILNGVNDPSQRQQLRCLIAQALSANSE